MAEVDGSDESVKALDAGIGLAKYNGAALVVLCVASLGSFPDDLRGIAADEVAHADRQNPKWPNLSRLPSWVASALGLIESLGPRDVLRSGP